MRAFFDLRYRASKGYEREYILLSVCVVTAILRLQLRGTYEELKKFIPKL